MTLTYTGCRISEALALTAEHIDLKAKVIIFKTLKQRGTAKHRSVPVPDELVEALELVHRIRKQRRSKSRPARLWRWGRPQATKHIWSVMEAAGIEGAQASQKSLRHGFGVRMAPKTRNPRLIQKWLGHTKLDKTAIYMDMVGEQERAEVLAAW